MDCQHSPISSKSPAKTDSYTNVDANNGSILGNRQSPIDLRHDIVIRDLALFPNSIKIDYHLGDCDKLTVHATGWTVHVNDQSISTLTASHLPCEFRLAQFHAHWGKDGNSGSEHLVGGKPLSGEMHFVFWNSKYDNFENAVKYGDGLAVLGVFLKECELPNSIYQPLIECIQRAIDTKSVVKFPADVDIEKMIPQNRDFWTYSGSLTTLPYNECVLWTVFKEPIFVSDAQLEIFRQIIIDNSRVPQELHGRPIRCSFE